jgi:sodium/potassium-transporting ATPase subunit alpha
LTIKGAPDVLISRCDSYIDRDGDRKVLDPIASTSIVRTKDHWSSQGKRVILLARKVVRRQDIRSEPTSIHFENEIMEHAKTGLTLVGIVGIVDPPRDDIPFVVRTLRSAGIRVMMVTTVPCFDNCERYTKQLNRLLVTLP